MKNTLEGIHSRLSDSEQLVSWKTKQWKSLSLNRKKKKKRMKRNEDSLKDLWNNVKHLHIRIQEDKRKGHEKIFEEIIAKKCP